MNRCVEQAFVVPAVDGEVGPAQGLPDEHFIGRRVLQPERGSGEISVDEPTTPTVIIRQEVTTARAEHHGERACFGRRSGCLETLKIIEIWI
jgi:hypothetical protein